MVGDEAGAPTVAEPVEWLSPSPRLLAMRLSELAFVVMLGVVVALAEGYKQGAGSVGLLAALSLLALGLVVVPVMIRRYRSWGYHEREADLLVRRGVMFRRLTVVPYGRMQLIDVTAGAVERVYGLQTVHLHTAAAATDARIPGLIPLEAARLRDRLAALGEVQAAGI